MEGVVNAVLDSRTLEQFRAAMMELNKELESPTDTAMPMCGWPRYYANKRCYAYHNMMQELGKDAPLEELTATCKEFPRAAEFITDTNFLVGDNFKTTNKPATLAVLACAKAMPRRQQVAISKLFWSLALELVKEPRSGDVLKLYDFIESLDA